jgi:hypothetical protein
VVEGVEVGDAEVGAARQPGVDGAAHDADDREPPLHLVAAAVGGGVVDHDDLELVGRPAGAQEVVDAADGHGAAVEVDDHDTDTRHPGHGVAQ